MKRDGYYFYKRRKRYSEESFHEIVHWGIGIFISIFFAFILVYFLGLNVNMDGNSMAPGLCDGQKVLVNRFVYKLSQPERGDVVMFVPNGNENTGYYIKRVVGVSGDRLQVISGTLYVNDTPSPYVTSKITDPGILVNEITVGQGTYFVMSDDVMSPDDSRNPNIGPVESRYIIGKVWYAFSEGDSGRHLVK
ncbi:MAG: signal peptidase I [Lachnospiraceae bacterium]|nr:signal peptidase I [Lachnospiraceae bacterium]